MIWIILLCCEVFLQIWNWICLWLTKNWNMGAPVLLIMTKKLYIHCIVKCIVFTLDYVQNWMHVFGCIFHTTIPPVLCFAKQWVTQSEHSRNSGTSWYNYVPLWTTKWQTILTFKAIKMIHMKDNDQNYLELYHKVSVADV